MPGRGLKCMIGVAALFVTTVMWTHDAFAQPTAAQRVASQTTAAQRSDTIVIPITSAVYPGGGTLVRVASIGDADGRSELEYEFASIYATTLGKDGSIFVVDRGAIMGAGAGGGRAVRQYDSTGKYIRSFGRAGDGPGEWQEPVDVELLPDGRVLVLSPRSARILVYAADGTPLAPWNAMGGRGDLGLNRLTVDASGHVWEQMSVLSLARERSSRYVRYASDGRVIDTVTPPVPPALPFAPPLTANGVNGRRSMARPYAPSFTYTLCRAGYFITGVTSRYSIDLRIPPTTSGTEGLWVPGHPVRSLRRDFTPVPVAADERAERLRLIEAFLRNTDPRWTWLGPELPRTKPAFRRLDCDMDGRIWVARHVPSQRRAPANPPIIGIVEPNVSYFEPRVYDILEPNGRYLGAVQIPDGYFVHVMRGNDVWTLRRDEDGVESLVRFRIVWR